MAVDEDRATPPKPHVVGEDLSALSVDDLGERIALLEAEIERLREAQRRKVASRSAADAVFKL